MRDGEDVRSYVHWALLDSFEWELGYNASFGLISIDRKSFMRTIKPSAWFLGGLAEANGIG